MSKVTTAVLRERIERLLKKWRLELDLDRWLIEVRFGNYEETGSCCAEPAYEEAVLSFNLNLIKKECWAYPALRELVVHELVHCIIWKSSERAVTQVTRAILRAHGLKYQ